jgi:hypothetical protein
MLKAIGLWFALAVVGLVIGMAGYAEFEDMSLADAYVNAAMILSGMGPLGGAENDGWKDFCRHLRNFLRSDNCHRNWLRIGSDLSPRTCIVFMSRLAVNSSSLDLSLKDEPPR